MVFAIAVTVGEHFKGVVGFIAAATHVRKYIAHFFLNGLINRFHFFIAVKVLCADPLFQFLFLCAFGLVEGDRKSVV